MTMAFVPVEFLERDAIISSTLSLLNNGSDSPEVVSTRSNTSNQRSKRQETSPMMTGSRFVDIFIVIFCLLPHRHPSLELWGVATRLPRFTQTLVASSGSPQLVPNHRHKMRSFADAVYPMAYNH